MTITSDLKWTKNTRNICDKVSQKFYILSKLKKFGLEVDELVVVWKTILRPLTEYAAPLWHSGLTEKDSQNLESLQKKVLGIILGVKYVDNKRLYKLGNKTFSYEQALEKLDLTLLVNRREGLTDKLALKSVKNDRHNIFQPKVKTVNTRTKSIVFENHYKTKRSYRAAVPYMTRILNNVKYVDDKEE